MALKISTIILASRSARPTCPAACWRSRVSAAPTSRHVALCEIKRREVIDWSKSCAFATEVRPFACFRDEDNPFHESQTFSVLVLAVPIGLSSW